MIFFLCAFVLCLILYLLLRNDYWESRGVPSYKPKFYFLNLIDFALKRDSMNNALKHIYRQFSTPYFGVSFFNKHVLVIRSPELVKDILVRDFDTFINHRSELPYSLDNLASKSIFFVTGERWKNLRTAISSSFLPKQLKLMYPLMNECIDNLLSYLERHDDCKVDMKDQVKRLFVDTVFSTAFGANVNSFLSQHSEIYQNAIKLVNGGSLKRNLSILCFFVSDKLVSWLKLTFADPEASAFLRNIFMDVFNQRRNTNTKRGDLFNKFLELYNDPSFKFDIEDMFSQSIAVMFGGFHGMTITIATVLHEISFNEQIQDKLRNEINQVHKKYGGFPYECLQELTYTEMVLNEALRKYPQGAFIIREAGRDYVFRTGLKIKKNTTVIIASSAYFHDPDYFPDPEKFDPERFAKKDQSTFFYPFLSGPRKCVGKLYAIIMMKVTLARLLSKFKFEKIDGIDYDMRMENTALFLEPVNGIFLRVKKIT